MSTLQPLLRTELTGPFATYRARPGEYDEMLAADGTVRPHWRRFLDGFLRLPADQLSAAVDSATRMLDEYDVTYVVKGDPEGSLRPWRLDLLPLLIDPKQWLSLERGLVQRATLLNAIVADIYGAQHVLTEQLLPPALVFGTPEFFPPCHGIGVRDGIFLHFLAFDIGRSHDGRWWVLSDRLQAPSGVGYALENRIIASRCLPELFTDANVHRLAPFFRSYSENLLSLAGHDERLAVVLTGGPTKETYFEHAFLGRYLGYPVVEGGDLTVRDRRVYLKTVEGLKLVDLILRRIPSDACDPLELKVDSLQGVPGLLQAARAGEVVIANAIGSGVIENEAIMSFLPGLARHFVGEDLLIPSIGTWWCGQEKERDYVLQNLDRLAVKRAFGARSLMVAGVDQFLDSEFPNRSAKSLAAMISNRPHQFVGQDRIELSRTPFWDGVGAVRPEPMTLRVYLAATKDGYRVMPGGLARISARHEGTKASTEFSKDVWVLSETSIDTFSMLPMSLQAPALRRSDRDLPSRAADNLFWLGRYLERTEAAVRLYRSLLTQLSGEARAASDPIGLEIISDLLITQELLSPRRARRATAEGARAVGAEIWSVIFDPDSPDGLAKVLGNVRRIAELVRERLSADTWRILEQLTEAPSLRWRGRNIPDAIKLLNTMIQSLSAVNGMVQENMTRGHGWRLLDMGRRIERARFAVKLVRSLSTRGKPEGTGVLNLLLDLADSTMTYRGRYKAVPQLPAVLDLLLADDSNPRSVIFQIVQMEEHMKVLPLEQQQVPISPGRKAIAALRIDLTLADMYRLSAVKSRAGLRSHLDRLTRRIEEGVDELSEIVARTYFSHSLGQRVSGSASNDDAP
jgi:uncharacterized circularly permuted ATP-grasp superfamily protein/uncharacterized alpha-E superfamily protein